MNLSKELYRVRAAIASSTLANSANPKRQLSLVRRSLTSKTRRSVPSLAPRLASPVVDATLAPFLLTGCLVRLFESDGLYSFATPLAKSSSVTEGSSPRRSRNCDGVLFGEASLSPTLTAFCVPRLEVSRIS